MLIEIYDNILLFLSLFSYSLKRSLQATLYISLFFKIQASGLNKFSRKKLVIQEVRAFTPVNYQTKNMICEEVLCHSGSKNKPICPFYTTVYTHFNIYLYTSVSKAMSF